MGNRITVIVKNDEKKTELSAVKGRKLIDLLRDNRIDILSPCSGKGSCGKCRVRFTGTEEELQKIRITNADRTYINNDDLQKGYRLACRCILDRDCVIEIEPSAFSEDDIFIPETDFFRGEESGDVKGNNSRDETDKTYACCKHSNDRGTGDIRYGIGIDIGTTTIAAALVAIQCDSPKSDTERSGDRSLRLGAVSNSNVVLVKAGINHQRKYGNDVISRIEASSSHSGELRSIVLEDISSLTDQLLSEGGYDRSEIEYVAIAGNTTMLHLMRGYDCRSLGRFPYTPVTLDIEELDSCPGICVGKCVLFPGFTTYVGADILAGLYAIEPWREDTAYLYLDLGTNGEIAAGKGDRLYITSTAAGPVFEGGGIANGCASIPGAICSAEFVTDDKGEARLCTETIGDEPPIGICGTGVLELVSALVRQGIVDESGLMSEPFFERGFHICDAHDGRQIMLTRNDIRQVQMAKAAVNAGIRQIAAKAFPGEKIMRIYLCGGFGTKVDINRIRELDMIPHGLLSDKCDIVAAGNTSLLGTVKFLNRIGQIGYHEALEELLCVRPLAQEISLATTDTFEADYYEAMNFRMIHNS